MEQLHETPPIKTTCTSLDIVEAIKNEKEQTISSLADELKLSVSTVHGHIKTLEQRGYVVRKNNEIQLGMKFFHLGKLALDRIQILEQAELTAEALSEQTNHEVDFNVAENGRLIALIHKLGQADQPGFQVGSYFYLHNTGSGKALLAAKPTSYVNQVVDYWGLPAETEKTITDRNELLRDLEQVEERGYSICDEEWLEGFRSVGRAVRGPEGEVLGAMAVGGPIYRLDMEKIRNGIGEMLIKAVDTLETKIR